MNKTRMKFNLVIFIYLISFLILVDCKKEINTTENISQDMLAEVNKLRKNGCQCGQDTMPPVRELKWNSILEEAALLHAKDMVEHNYFDHFGLDSSVPIQRAIELGYTGTAVGENIARGYTSISEVMQAWKSSEEHCKNMMDSSYYEMGAATTNEYWVQEFGSIDVFKQPATINNTSDKNRNSIFIFKEVY
jgi:uncharacterized protein YkwD